MTESQAAKLVGTGMLIALVLALLGTMIGYLIYSNDQMLKSLLDKGKRMECAITMPNQNGVDLNPDALPQ